MKKIYKALEKISRVLKCIFLPLMVIISSIGFIISVVVCIGGIDAKAISYNPSIIGVEQYSINPYVQFDSWDGFFQADKYGEMVISTDEDVGERHKDNYTAFTFSDAYPVRDFYQSWAFSTNGRNLAPSSVITKDMAKTTFRFTVVYNFGFASDSTFSSKFTGQYLHDHYGLSFDTPYFFIYTKPKNYGGSPLQCTIVDQVISYSNAINVSYSVSNQVTYEVKFSETDDTIIYGMWTKCSLNISDETLRLINNDFITENTYTMYEVDVYDIQYGYSKAQMTQFMKEWANELDKFYGGIDDFHNNVFFTDGSGHYYTFDDFVDGDIFDDIFKNFRLAEGLSFWNQMLTKLTSIYHIEFIILGALCIGFLGLYFGLKVR